VELGEPLGQGVNALSGKPLKLNQNFSSAPVELSEVIQVELTA